MHTTTKQLLKLNARERACFIRFCIKWKIRIVEA